MKTVFWLVLEPFKERCMFVWIGIDVDSQYGEIKDLAKNIDREMNFKHSCFTLPMHISLKISFKIAENEYEDIKNTIFSVFEGQKPFEIPVKAIEDEGNICWIRMQENDCLNELSAQINQILKKKHNISLHEYDLDFKFHTSLFLDDDCDKVHMAFERIKTAQLPKTLIAKRFVIGTSESGKLGTYKVVETFEI